MPKHSASLQLTKWKGGGIAMGVEFYYVLIISLVHTIS